MLMIVAGLLWIAMAEDKFFFFFVFILDNLGSPGASAGLLCSSRTTRFRTLSLNAKGCVTDLEVRLVPPALFAEMSKWPRE